MFKSPSALLADGEEPIAAIPDVADPVQAEAPAIVTVPQIRDETVTAHARLGAESDDGVLPLLVGILLGETEELLVERGPQTQAVHHGQHLVGRRVADQVDVLQGDLAVLLGDGLAALDRIEPLALVIGVDVGREPALQLLELGLDVDDLSRERRVAVLRSTPVRMSRTRRGIDGLQLLGLPVGVSQVDDLLNRLPTACLAEAMNRLERDTIVPNDPHEGTQEPSKKSDSALDIRRARLAHGRPRSLWRTPHPNASAGPRVCHFRSQIST